MTGCDGGTAQALTGMRRIASDSHLNVTKNASAAVRPVAYMTCCTIGIARLLPRQASATHCSKPSSYLESYCPYPTHDGLGCPCRDLLADNDGQQCLETVWPDTGLGVTDPFQCLGDVTVVCCDDF